MGRKKIVGYVRVSLEKQVEGYSIDGQVDEIKKTAQFKDFDIKEIYKEEGKSGKSVEGRPEFQRMLKDISESGDIDYVVVFKLSRFGRNILDVLNSLEYIRRYGVELYTIEDGIDTSTASGKLLVPVLGAVAERLSAKIYLRRQCWDATERRKPGVGMEVSLHMDMYWLMVS